MDLVTGYVEVFCAQISEGSATQFSAMDGNPSPRDIEFSGRNKRRLRRRCIGFNGIRSFSGKNFWRGLELMSVAKFTNGCEMTEHEVDLLDISSGDKSTR